MKRGMVAKSQRTQVKRPAYWEAVCDAIRTEFKASAKDRRGDSHMVIRTDADRRDLCLLRDDALSNNNSLRERSHGLLRSDRHGGIAG